MALVPVLLCDVTCRGEIPLVRIESVDSTMNRDYLRVQGTVARYPDYDPITERLTFWLDDGTGIVLVILETDTSRVVLDRGGVPTIGDRVSVAGIVHLGTTKAWGDFVSLTVSELASLNVEPLAPVESSIADAAAGAPYSKVQVQGQVSQVWQPYEGLTVLRIRDRTGEIDVVYDQDLVWISGAPTTVFPEDAISVRGAVVIYEGQAQIVLDAASGLQRLPALALSSTAMAHSPTATLAARPATVTPVALATRLKPVPTFTASTVSASPTAMATLVSDLGGDAARRPEADGTSGTDRAQRLETGLLSETHLGSSVTIEGHIDRVTLLSAGCQSVVNDGSGPTVVWLPDALYAQLVDPEGWNVGALVRVTGRVSEYKGELEVVPQTQDAIVTLQRSFPAVGPDAAIGSLGAADLGRRVTVEGDVVAVDPFSAGTIFMLDDGSGQIILLLWQNVFEMLAGREFLTVGARVRASGWVQEYQGDLEIVPGLPYDVAILASMGGP